jgi:hypothetical protein
MPPVILSSSRWARRQFGSVDLSDQRRDRRVIAMAAHLVRNPSASLPAQMGSLKVLKAAYRVLDEEDVSYEALMTPHWKQTCRFASQERLVLMVQDTTVIDHTHHPTTKGLGPIGNNRGYGYLLHTVLAVIPKPRRVLGIAHQEPFLRQPAPKESCNQRRQRPRESQVWSRAAQAVGASPENSMWVHVGDRYSDIFEFMALCIASGSDFLLRAAQDRRMETEDGTQDHVVSFARRLSEQGERSIKVPARKKRPARTACVQIAFSPITILPPKGSPFRESLSVWVVRVWEPEPPAEEDEPLEWILLTSVMTQVEDEAWDRVEWYKCRWVSEDYHQCLKTGCSIEKRQLREKERLWRLLGLLAPVALRLLQLRDIVRLSPEDPAISTLPKDLVQVVAHLTEVPLESLTMKGFWWAVAQQGGFLGRRRDGPPGWKTIWRGWLHVQTLLEGVRLASRLPP